MEQSVKERDPRLDLLRITAVFFVLSLHSLIELGFYGHPVGGRQYFAACCLRHLFMSSVPLFLMLTGYLMNGKTWSRSYLKGISGTVLIYVLASLLSIPMQIHRETYTTVRQLVLAFLNFSLAPYSWYIEMYMGLYLILPMLNSAYHGMQNGRGKRLLVCIFLLLTAVPCVFNIFDLSEPGWWRDPLGHLGDQKLLPFYWYALFPFTYYFLGCYLRELPPRHSKKGLILLLGITTLSGGLINYLASLGKNFVWGRWQNWGSILNVLTAWLIFRIFLAMDGSGWSAGTKKGLRSFAELSLGIYLISWNFDKLYYGMLAHRLAEDTLHMEYFLPMVLLIYGSSAVISGGMNAVRAGVFGLAARIRRKRDVNHEDTNCSDDGL